MQTDSINTIILDLGQVIVPVDQDRTLRGLSCFVDPSRMQASALHPFFGTIARYENGEISDEEFLAALSLFLHQLNPSLPADYPSRQTLIDIWNAMIPELPARNLTLLKKIRQHYKLYLLSNTNGLHVEYLDHLLPQGSAGFKPENCLFVDDRAENIEAARSTGLNAIHLTDFNLGKLFREDGRLAPDAPII